MLFSWSPYTWPQVANVMAGAAGIGAGAALIAGDFESRAYASALQGELGSSDSSGAGANIPILAPVGKYAGSCLPWTASRML